MTHQLADLLDIPRLQSVLDSLYINGHLHEATPSITYKCLHGLMETAAPIIIEGEHLGNVFTGQMFCEEPDLEYFRGQAKVYGFDEGTYIDAVKKVPIISEQASQENLAVIADLTGMLAEMGLKRMREKEAGRQLRESEERYRALFQNISSGFALHEIILDADGKPCDYRFLDVNPAFTTLTGFKAEDVIGRTVLEVMPGTEPYWIDTYGKVALTGKPVGFENFSRELDRQYSVTAYSPMHGRFATIFHDITERKRAKEEKRNLEWQVQQAQKLESLGVLAGGIAHDFNNLLMVVLGNAELAFDAISPMSPARWNLEEITAAAQRAADLSRQMLAYAGKAAFMLERVGLRELVEEMAQLLQSAISKKVILTLNLERGLPPIEADPSQIRQIVRNLIINASEAIGDRNGVITMSVGATQCDQEYLRKTELHDDLAPGLYVHLEVTDTGIGMDAETRSRIFEPFFSTKFTGRGLGLAAVLGIVRAHKGALKVSSEPGKGTTFKILFPALTDTV